ncbi:DUF397 domain-containing protein [Streptomyces rapamycinicus]|uniref:DUF397 domain-containing protein n=2 Tax=Streptomyces rapamycinicus TaxID=1226757 RepID=A0A0A0NH05_STRRN|nr:DUF397 domain-containing protein [Streptomyces rapamycinicus]AGP58837.1 hypothetical protein M271_37180 [Streptomyces rapamycinicus NRRL 5491]MBB4786558.1 hypothetical protein [Streptomyces rapamycinicus]RLV77983.1 hypothetical protein D3C57_106400 [Streptomyces rapamycinicus NRRL 5491]UTO66641.1 DUF397 domain-containing protein [Streptomyces rapamycinicus]UTP34594.1 DUF397 domain-containing protein [Streptomyces rapamycinicus NRRL 5491]
MNHKQAGSDTPELSWFKSSYSDNEGGMCVEVAATADTVHVRDSKNRHGEQLAFSIRQWDAFIGRLTAEEFGA